MKKILIYGMTNIKGGIENYVYNIANEFDKEIQFDFLIHYKEMAFEKEMLEKGSKIYFIPGKSQGILKHIKAFWNFLRKHIEYDVIYFNVMDPMVFPTVAVARLMGRKCVVHSHNGDIMKSKAQKACRSLLNFFVDQRMSCSVCASEYLFGKKNIKDTIVIHNKIDAEKFIYDPEIRKRKRKELGVEGKFVLCHVGRLTYQKNPKEIIDILAELIKTEKEVVLLSVGTGDLASETEQYAADKKVMPFIRFLGVRNDIHEIMQAADVFVLPSLYEGLPIVGIEAQASGLPCVFSDYITRETDITGNVYFLPLGDNKKWCDMILKCRKSERKNQLENIISKGYDLKHPLDKGTIRQCLSKEKKDENFCRNVDL